MEGSWIIVHGSWQAVNCSLFYFTNTYTSLTLKYGYEL
jgi:hypothetical protein